jgi:hypothetical protein
VCSDILCLELLPPRAPLLRLLSRRGAPSLSARPTHCPVATSMKNPLQTPASASPPCHLLNDSADLSFYSQRQAMACLGLPQPTQVTVPPGKVETLTPQPSPEIISQKQATNPFYFISASAWPVTEASFGGRVGRSSEAHPGLFPFRMVMSSGQPGARALCSRGTWAVEWGGLTSSHSSLHWAHLGVAPTEKSL